MAGHRVADRRGAARLLEHADADAREPRIAIDAAGAAVVAWRQGHVMVSRFDGR